MTTKKADLIPWEPNVVSIVKDTTSSIPRIVDAAKQLRQRERSQVLANFEAQHYEVAATFVWHRTIALLKKQLGSLGNEFISELLQRPDINEKTDIASAISDTDAITLARDLGMLTSTQAMRLVHSQEVVSHFASIDDDIDEDDDAFMTHEEAISCLRVCVQGVLGHEKIEVAENFAEFRKNLESKTFTAGSAEIIKLQQSPYFFIRTAISVLLAVIRAGKGASLEHGARNAQLIIPMFWNKLKKPERWQIGQVYASEFNEGRKESVRALSSVLVRVKGFDYVPENLRSNTFTRVASEVVNAHQGLNNFYNEPAPMRELVNLGSSIPSPALASCITAALCVKLGNAYGISHAAQSYADELLASISKDRWYFYLDGRLENDVLILSKLRGGSPLDRWMEFVKTVDIELSDIKNKDVRSLVQASIDGKKSNAGLVADKLFRKA